MVILLVYHVMILTVLYVQLMVQIVQNVELDIVY